MIEFDALSFSYSPDNPLISSLKGRWEKKFIHVLIGPSGCGKSTLLYLLAGLLIPDEGSLLIGAKPAIPGRKKTGVILQNHGLFPWKTAYDNLALGLEIRKINPAVQKEKVFRILKELGLNDKAGAYPSELSGGEQQRLAIGRALILNPDLLLLDEPFSSLDAMTRERLQDRLWQLKHKPSEPSGTEDLTIVHVTHSIEEAVFLGDRIHMMDDAGRLESLENNSSGPGYRLNSEYFDRCVALRRHFEKHTGRTQ